MDTLEHCRKPWALAKTIAIHLRPNGHAMFVAPFSFFEHRHPIDCWRFAPDGMRCLLEGELKVLRCNIRHYGIRPSPKLWLAGKWIKPLATVCVAKKEVQ